MIHGLQFKLFLWFCALSLVVRTLVVLAIGYQYESVEPKWMIGALDTYAQRAVEVYGAKGGSGLTQYLSEIESKLRIRASLLDPGQNDIGQRGIPPATQGVLREAQSLNRSRFRTGLCWCGASVVPTAAGRYIFVAQITPAPDAMLQTRLIRWAALLVGGMLCLILARHVTAPIRSLQGAADRFASGDLSARAAPAICSRKDELADLARAFDLMAVRIQALLHKQKQLLGDVSHELRSPLARLGVSLELLRRGETDSIERMRSDLDRLNHLIERILTLARLDTHENKSDTMLNLRQIVEGVAEDANFEGQDHGKSVELEPAEDLWMKGDPALLRSCVENVVRNAVQFTKPGTKVVVAMRFDGTGDPSSASIVVADQGSGVPEDALARLFEPFFRVATPTGPQSHGGGLGLAIAARVAALHGGTIGAHNRKEGGLEVEIRIPASRPAA